MAQSAPCSASLLCGAAPNVEVLVERRPDAYLNVVEVDEYGDVDAVLMCQNVSPSESLMRSHDDRMS